MSKSDYLENKLLDHVLGGPDYTRPATVYVGLWKGNPGEAAAGGAEVAGGSYGRVAYTNNATNFPAASGGSKSNGTTITFPTPTADWSASLNDITHFVIFDALSGGNLLRYGALTTPKTIGTGDLVTFPPGSLVSTED